MTKYKYSSQLSSEFRQLFKSYHSLDRCQQKLRQKITYSNSKYTTNDFSPNKKLYTNDSLKLKKYDTQKLLQTRYISKKRYTILQTNHFDKNNQNNQPQSFYLQRLNSLQTNYHKNNNKLKLQKDQDKSEDSYKELYQKRIQQEKLRQNHQQYLSSFNFRQRQIYQNYKNSRQNNQIRSNLYDLDYLNRTSYQASRNNKDLKSKIHQINKRRNQIKLKIRVNDNSKMNEKYTKAIQSPYSSSTTHQKQNLTPFLKSRPQPLPPHLYNHFSYFPVQESFFTAQNPPLKHLFLENIRKEQQFLKTPHFYNEQNPYKMREDIIEKNLGNIVKYTYTDRV